MLLRWQVYTSDSPSRVEPWRHLGLEFRAEYWDDLVLMECKPSVKNPTFIVVAGSMLTYMAATLPPIPTGFLDRNPKGTPGLLRRWLGRTTFSDLPPVMNGRIHKKSSVNENFPKGILGHRRSTQLTPI